MKSDETLFSLEFWWRYWCRQRKKPKNLYRRKLLWKIDKAGRKIENWGLQNSINFLLVLDVFRLSIYHSSYLLYLKFYSSDLWDTERGQPYVACFAAKSILIWGASFCIHYSNVWERHIVVKVTHLVLWWCFLMFLALLSFSIRIYKVPTVFKFQVF